MGKYWGPPVNHPISIEKAKELLAGNLGDVYRQILFGCCVPIYWFSLDKENPISSNNSLIYLTYSNYKAKLYKKFK